MGTLYFTTLYYFTHSFAIINIEVEQYTWTPAKLYSPWPFSSLCSRPASSSALLPLSCPTSSKALLPLSRPREAHLLRHQLTGELLPLLPPYVFELSHHRLLYHPLDVAISELDIRSPGSFLNYYLDVIVDTTLIDFYFNAPNQNWTIVTINIWLTSRNDIITKQDVISTGWVS